MSRLLTGYARRTSQALAGDSDRLDSIESAAQRMLNKIGGKRRQDVGALDYLRDDDAVVMRVDSGASQLLEDLADRGILEKKFSGVQDRFYFNDQHFGQLEVRASNWQTAFLA